LLDVFGAYHSAIRYDAKVFDAKTVANTIGDRTKRRYISRIAWPHLATNRLSFVVDDRAYDHLVQIRPVILTETSFTQAMPAIAFTRFYTCGPLDRFDR
jgi:hypothetical protein